MEYRVMRDGEKIGTVTGNSVDEAKANVYYKRPEAKVDYDRFGPGTTLEESND